MAHLRTTIILVIVLVATNAGIFDSSASSAGPVRSSVHSRSHVIEALVPTPTPAPVATTPDIEPLTDAEQALVDWAIDRFSQAGLELPELTVRFDPTRELCGNSEGLYHRPANEQPVVTICTREGDTFAAQLARRRTLLHEFGHAWDVANLSPAEHEELGRILGADAWNDHDDAWGERGAERFAETFVFALLDQPARQLKVGVGCSDLLDAFRTATGTEPVGPGLPYCVAS